MPVVRLLAGRMGGTPAGGTAHVGARVLNPCDEGTRGVAHVVGAKLRRHVFLELPDDAAEIRLAQALVTVGEDGEGDDHVGMRELGGARGRVLANKGYREQPPLAWDVGRETGGWLKLSFREKAKGDAVDLIGAVRWVVSGPRRSLVTTIGYWRRLVGGRSCRGKASEHTAGDCGRVHGWQEATRAAAATHLGENKGDNRVEKLSREVQHLEARAVRLQLHQPVLRQSAIAVEKRERLLLRENPQPKVQEHEHHPLRE